MQRKPVPPDLFPLAIAVAAFLTVCLVAGPTCSPGPGLENGVDSPGNGNSDNESSDPSAGGDSSDTGDPSGDGGTSSCGNDNQAYGINAHIPDDTTVGFIQDAGIAWVRMSVAWHLFEAQPGQYDWDWLDGRIAAVRAKDLRILMVLQGTPSWSSGTSNPADPPGQPGDWSDFVYRMVDRYEADIQHWGLWNEPNGGENGTEYWSGTPAEFRDVILKPGAASARAADPACRIVAPDLTIHTGWADSMQVIMSEGGAAATDIIGVHLYVNGDADDLWFHVDDHAEPYGGIKPLTRVLADLNLTDKEVWLTETGWPTDGPNAVSEVNQSAYLHDLLWKVCNSSVIDKIFPYEIIDDPSSPEGAFGLLRSDYSLKPGYRMYRDFIEEPTPYLCTCWIKDHAMK